MSRQQIFTDQPISLGTSLTLDSETSHHLIHVLRLSPGKQINVAQTNSGKKFLCTFTGSTGGLAELSVDNLIQETPGDPSVVETLLCAVLKGDHNDLVCEKACELGAGQIIFWAAERSVVQLKDSQSCEKKLARWRKIAASAAAQSKRSTIPGIYLAESLAAAMGILNKDCKTEDLRIYCALGAEIPPMRNLSPGAGRVHLLIGPEGDFTPVEQMLAENEGFVGAGLGALTLRSETAAIAAVAMANALWGKT